MRLHLISRQISHFIYNGKSLQWLITAWLPQLEELHPKNEVTFCQCRICISKRACVKVLLVASVWPTNHFTQLHESEITQWQGCFLLCRIKRIWRVCESRAGSLALYRAPALSRSLVGVLLESTHTTLHTLKSLLLLRFGVATNLAARWYRCSWAVAKMYTVYNGNKVSYTLKNKGSIWFPKFHSDAMAEKNHFYNLKNLFTL